MQVPSRFGASLGSLIAAAALLLGSTTDSEARASGPAHPIHPLDGLSEEEYTAAVTILETEKHLDEATRFPLITLDDPPKSEVLAWKMGEAVRRRALVIVKQRSRTHEAVVDLGARKVVSWREAKGVQPGVLMTEEWNFASKIVRAHAGWQAAIREREIDDPGKIVCVPHTVGHYGGNEERRRLAKVTCYDGRGVQNYWGRPIEGLVALVDFDARAVVKLVDSGPIPVPKARVDFDPSSVGPLRRPPNPIATTQAAGPSFELAGSVVRWQNWQFHYRNDPRVGPTLSLVRYEEGGKPRSVLYQASLSELFVPYMDPDVGWYFRTYMDAGEYGVGRLAAPLEAGLDCPPNAVFLPAVFADDWGDPYTREQATCLFERYAGNVAWRHYESVTQQSEVRRRTELVLRFVAAIGSYDYVFDWIFGQDGAIRVAIGASGVAQVKAVRARTAADDPSSRATAYGRLVAERTLAVNHDHFFSFRLDLDVDGPRNSLVVERLATRFVGGESPRKSVWVVEPRTATSERQAQLRIDLEKPALWRVINPNVTGPLGYPVSYQLKPGTNAISLLSADDPLQRRAAFTDFHLWVTPYDARERYAAGMYPNQSPGGTGLAAWTRADRPIQNRDIVLWYTVGFHHVVRAEDWPVLPLGYVEFELKPFDFFPRNPALDLPRETPLE